MNKDHRVFVSEEQLYGSDKAINHRIREKNKEVYARLLNRMIGTTAFSAHYLQLVMQKWRKSYLIMPSWWQPDPAVL